MKVTTIHLVKNFLLKIYLVPYMGMGQRITKEIVMKSAPPIAQLVPGVAQ
jgi:hypothetical protein